MKKIFQPTDCLSREEMTLYSKGEVSGDLQFKIENHLLDCPLCNEAMEGMQQMDTEGGALLDEIYAAVDAKTQSNVVLKSRPRFSWNNMAATILLLITVGAALFYYTQQPQTDNYLAYFEESNDKFRVRGIDKNVLPKEIQAGVNLYEAENFQGSLSFFQDYLEQEEESTEATYYAGMAAMKIGELTKAFDYLSVVRLNDDRLFEEATWSMIKIHLDLGEKSEAKMLLNDLVKLKGGFFNEKAKALLDEI